jgi:hypothetical protein
MQNQRLPPGRINFHRLSSIFWQIFSNWVNLNVQIWVLSKNLKNSTVPIVQRANTVDKIVSFINLSQLSTHSISNLIQNLSFLTMNIFYL